jgi:hypothetical protein
VLQAPTGALEEAAATWPLQNSALATFPDGPSANLGLLVVFLLWKVPFHFDVKIKDPELFLVPRHRPLGRVDGYFAAIDASPNATHLRAVVTGDAFWFRFDSMALAIATTDYQLEPLVVHVQLFLIFMLAMEMAQMGKFAAAVIRRGTKTSSPTNFRQLDYTLPFGCNFAGTHFEPLDRGVVANGMERAVVGMIYKRCDLS